MNEQNWSTFRQLAGTSTVKVVIVSLVILLGLIVLTKSWLLLAVLSAMAVFVTAALLFHQHGHPITNPIYNWWNSIPSMPPSKAFFQMAVLAFAAFTVSLGLSFIFDTLGWWGW